MTLHHSLIAWLCFGSSPQSLFNLYLLCIGESLMDKVELDSDESSEEEEEDEELEAQEEEKSSGKL